MFVMKTGTVAVRSIRHQLRNLLGPRASTSMSASSEARTRIVAVGDVHGDWAQEDNKALQALRPGAGKHVC
jgi:hypothetical protein